MQFLMFNVLYISMCVCVHVKARLYSLPSLRQGLSHWPGAHFRPLTNKPQESSSPVSTPVLGL